MRLGTWLGLLAAIAVGTACGDDSSDENDTSSEEARAIAEALTDGIEFENGLLRSGSIPEASADTVRLSQDDDVLRLAPGDSSLMSLGVENPNEDDPVESALMQFEDAEDHVEVPADEADAGASDELSLSFGVDDGICDAFCNKIFTIKMIQAVKLRGGDVSRHLLRTFELDCTEHGHANLCDDDGEDEPDAGGSAGRSGSGGRSASGGTGGSSATTSVAMELRSSIAQVNVAACMCSEPGMTSSTCADAPYPSTAVTCLFDAVSGDAALSAAASCVTQRLNAGGSSACSCADTACYGDAIANAYAMCETSAEFETALADCEIASTPAGASP